MEFDETPTNILIPSQVTYRPLETLPILNNNDFQLVAPAQLIYRQMMKFVPSMSSGTQTQQQTTPRRTVQARALRNLFIKAGNSLLVKLYTNITNNPERVAKRCLFNPLLHDRNVFKNKQMTSAPYVESKNSKAIQNKPLAQDDHVQDIFDKDMIEIPDDDDVMQWESIPEQSSSTFFSDDSDSNGFVNQWNTINMQCP